MKNFFTGFRKKNAGFTIVELVIVIAVIAILAAVLIPTFSNIIKKANLNSDMQAVRQMNEALAEWEAANGYPDRNKMTIEDAMKVIADAGYDVDSWNPLTEGYQVYWFKSDNRCILYNTATRQVEYPAEYTNQDLTDVKNAGKFYVYNQTFKKAIAQDLTFTSSSSKNVTVGDTTYKSALVTTSGDSVNYASAIVYQNEGDTTTYRVAVKTNGSVSSDDIASAQKAAGEYVYAIFQQMNQDIINVESVIIEPGTTIDITGIKWRPLRELVNGYFGTNDDNNPVTINGLTIDNTLSFTETYIARGQSNPIYLTGFIGAVSGNTTIENVKFTNVSIDHAASDRKVSTTAKDASNSAIIGGIVANEDIKDSNGNKIGDTPTVVIKNVTVDNCNIKAVRRAAGLVGFIGGVNWTEGNDESGYRSLKGTVTISNCSVTGCTIETDALTDAGQSSYAVAGGIVGFINKASSTLQVNISNCSCTNSSLNGKTTISGAIVADFSPNKNSTLTVNNCSASGNTNNGNALATKINIGSSNGTLIIDGATKTASGAY